MANAIKLADIRRENKECKNSVKGCIKYLYANEGSQTKALLSLYGDKKQVFGLADLIESDLHIGEQATKKDGTLRTSKAGTPIIVKVSVDLVARWFVANQAKAALQAKRAAKVVAEQKAAEKKAA